MVDEIMKKVVCLGGGIGTVNLLKGLKKENLDLSVVISMADEGGSSGRLRRLFKTPPTGDLVSCMAAMLDDKKIAQKLLTYRFPGNRYGSDESLMGHKEGNLIMFGLIKILGDFNKAIEELKHMFNIKGNFFPATLKPVAISAITCEGKEIFGEQTIDLGQYRGQRVLERVFLHPQNAKANPYALTSINQADVIIAGPGDLYTTILPVLIIKDIAKALISSKAKKIFVVNVANKPFETNGYKVSDYLKALKDHLGVMPFEVIIVNTNNSSEIPHKYNYHYVKFDGDKKDDFFALKDLIDRNFPLYHDPVKLAKAVLEKI